MLNEIGSSTDGPLSPYRVLELPGEAGLMCGKIMADLGADVIKIEPPGGDPSRSVGPFYHDEPDPEKSLYWFALNTNKRSITLDLQSNDGRDVFRRLVRTADFAIERFPPGQLDQSGIGFSSLQEINPRLILASITPFGQTGPYAGYKGSDIVAWAMGGYMHLCGEPDRAPLRISLAPQAYFHASAAAAAGCLIAHHYRERTGCGQHVDQSMQQPPAWMLTNTSQMWEFTHINQGRQGTWRQFGPVHVKTVFPCADGFIVWMLAGGVIGAKGTRRMVEWMDSEGYAPEWLKVLKWEEFSATAATQEQ
ncbi:MAG: CoA transferase, partial [Dehalococcoidia bacterium]|nr:CoA transferase [Dehalococcoidia bacterium]